MILANLEVIWRLRTVTPDLELSASRGFTYLSSVPDLRARCLAAVVSDRISHIYPLNSDRICVVSE